MQNSYFLLRHGETIYQTKKRNEKYPWPEKIPILLTEKGKEQVRVVGKKLKKENIDLIYSSDASRARETSQIIAKQLGVKVIFDSRLRDIHRGIFGGLPRKEHDSFFQSKRERFSKCPPEGESWHDVKERMFAFFKDVDGRYREKRILIVSHGDPLWLLSGYVKGLNETELLEGRGKDLSFDIAQFRQLEK